MLDSTRRWHGTEAGSLTTHQSVDSRGHEVRRAIPQVRVDAAEGHAENHLELRERRRGWNAPAVLVTRNGGMILQAEQCREIILRQSGTPPEQPDSWLSSMFLPPHMCSDTIAIFLCILFSRTDRV